MRLKKRCGVPIAAAGVLLLSACGGGDGGSAVVTDSHAGNGGGSGGGGTPALAAGVDISGTAALGKALAAATATVRCAKGSASTTTASDGMFAVHIDGGALPCLVEVSGTTSSGPVTLHSAVAAGTRDGVRIHGTAHATPITELVLAQLLKALPASVFASLDPAAITVDRMTAAARTVLAALKTAGIDAAGIDPFQSELVAASGNGGNGNAHDRLLDELGLRLHPGSLPLVANQIAQSAAGPSAIGLEQAIAAVAGGSLPNCPYAVSGRYRTIDYPGPTTVWKIDFQAGTFQGVEGVNGASHYTITADATNPCQFTATDTVGATPTRMDIVIGASGVGAYRTTVTGNPGTFGYIVPVQAHSVADVEGTWTFLQSGNMPGLGGWGHSAGRFTFANGTLRECDYDTTTWTCVPEGSSFTLSARTDGGIDVNVASAPGVINLWAYSAPNGAKAVFGTTNPDGASFNRTSLVATQLAKLDLPAVNASSSYWDIEASGIGTSTPALSGPTAQATTVLTVDGGTATVTRRRASDGRVDTVHYNQPLDGMRTRDGGATFAAARMMTLAGLGVNASVDLFDAAPHFYVISVNRP